MVAEADHRRVVLVLVAPAAVTVPVTPRLGTAGLGRRRGFARMDRLLAGRTLRTQCTLLARLAFLAGSTLLAGLALFPRLGFARLGIRLLAWLALLAVWAGLAPRPRPRLSSSLSSGDSSPSIAISGISRLISRLMAATCLPSSGAASVKARPALPARPVRPMRWT